jgi:lactoylglutathione lyase
MVKVMPNIVLESIVVRCTEIERSRAFYELLGLSFVREQHGGGPVHYSTRLGQTLLELYPSKTAASPMRFGVRTSEFDACIATLKAMGSGLTSVDALGSAAVLRDPDGHVVDLLRGDASDTASEGETPSPVARAPR